ncbi:MAG: hypothetical protein KAT34_04300 [Candidatus Aminicenantes bacterium]|nr:hypothetical protein [Candidatus Aminicenantes bacterium]
MKTINNQTLKIWSKDNNRMMLLFFISIAAVYYLPFRLNQFIFLVFLFLAYGSKKDYFWIAFYFILLDAPGGLFQGGSITDVHRIPFYPIIPGVALSFNDLLILMYLFKTIGIKRKYRFIFKKDFVFLLFFTLFVLLYSLIVGMSADNMISTFRILMSWSFIYIISKLLIKESDFDRLNRLLFPIVFLALASQMYSYLTGNYLGRFLKGFSFRKSLLLLTADSGEVARAADSSIILLYCFTLALFYLFSKKQVFPRRYLYLIIAICMFSVFLSATRGWIIAYIFFFFMVFITANKSKNIKKFISIGVVSTLVIVLFSFLFPLIKVQLQRVTERVGTVLALAEGDITAGGTLARFDKRGPRVMKKFSESPIIGWGFSKEYFQHEDHHVGHHNILLNVGIIGYIILNFIFFKWCLRIYRFARFQPAQVKYGQSAIKILCFAFLAMYIIHSSSAQSWGWDIELPKILFFSLLLSFFNIVYRNTALLNHADINK